MKTEEVELERIWSKEFIFRPTIGTVPNIFLTNYSRFYYLSVSELKEKKTFLSAVWVTFLLGCFFNASSFTSFPVYAFSSSSTKEVS